ncbi:MAG: efflux RND transporter periplasmic adaptor subunit [Candidatus Moranbacteria bacterium]|nr:efflux RND transporter periplasmic adaptor subunit [Candidatus Moranbacteria bacterium]
MKSKKSLIIGIAIVVIIAGTVAYLRRPTEPAATNGGVHPVQVGIRQVSESRSAQVSLSFPGTVTAEGVANVSAGSDGTVVSSNIRLGQKVGIGTVLARIDDPSGSIASDSGFRNADIRNAELSVERAKLSYTESKRADGNTSTHASELSKDLAKKNLESAQATLTALLDRHIIKSPIAGTVTSRDVATGDSVKTGDPLYVIENGSATMTVTFYVSESERALLVPGSTIRIMRTPNDTQPVSGMLKRVSSAADPASRRFLAEATVTDRNSVLPGTSVSVFADATLNPSGSGHFFLPLSAVAIESSGTSSIFTIQEGIAKRIPVDVVRIEGETAEVSADLQDDTRIIIENAKRVKDGEAVASK